MDGVAVSAVVVGGGRSGDARWAGAHDEARDETQPAVDVGEAPQLPIIEHPLDSPHADLAVDDDEAPWLTRSGL
jgi:hypothetical protein